MFILTRRRLVPIAFLVLGCICLVLILFWNAPREAIYIGESTNWKVKLVQYPVQERLSESFRYIGGDSSIAGFHYEFNSKILNGSGSAPNNESVPFQYEVTTLVLGQKKLEEPIQVRIRWNNQQETILLNQSQ